MKKILAFLMTICMLAGAFTMTAFAEDPVVLSIGAIKNDGYQTHLSSYTDFVEGWSAAM